MKYRPISILLITALLNMVSVPTINTTISNEGLSLSCILSEQASLRPMAAREAGKIIPSRSDLKPALSRNDRKKITVAFRLTRKLAKVKGLCDIHALLYKRILERLGIRAEVAFYNGHHCLILTGYAPLYRVDALPEADIFTTDAENYPVIVKPGDGAVGQYYKKFKIVRANTSHDKFLQISDKIAASIYANNIEAIEKAVAVVMLPEHTESQPAQDRLEEQRQGIVSTLRYTDGNKYIPHVALVSTATVNRCPVGCRHCAFSKAWDNRAMLSDKEFDTLLRDLRRLKIYWVGVSPEIEPLSGERNIKRVLKLFSGLPRTTNYFAIVTSGHFACDEKSARAVLDRLEKAYCGAPGTVLKPNPEVSLSQV